MAPFMPPAAPLFLDCLLRFTRACPCLTLCQPSGSDLVIPLMPHRKDHDCLQAVVRPKIPERRTEKGGTRTRKEEGNKAGKGKLGRKTRTAGGKGRGKGDKQGEEGKETGREGRPEGMDRVPERRKGRGKTRRNTREARPRHTCTRAHSPIRLRLAEAELSRVVESHTHTHT
eukprot:355980-Chlamydomonas_euryale.AAC.1